MHPASEWPASGSGHFEAEAGEHDLPAAQALRRLDLVEASPRVGVHGVEWLRRHDERECSFVDATSFVLMRSKKIHKAPAFDGGFTAAGFVELRP